MPSASVMEKLKILGKGCQNGVGKQSSQEIHTLTDDLKALKDRKDLETIDSVKSLQQRLNCLLDQENLRWMQRAKLHWFCGGE